MSRHSGRGQARPSCCCCCCRPRALAAGCLCYIGFLGLLGVGVGVAARASRPRKFPRRFPAMGNFSGANLHGQRTAARPPARPCCCCCSWSSQPPWPRKTGAVSERILIIPGQLSTSSSSSLLSLLSSPSVNLYLTHPSARQCVSPLPPPPTVAMSARTLFRTGLNVPRCAIPRYATSSLLPTSRMITTQALPQPPQTRSFFRRPGLLLGLLAVPLLATPLYLDSDDPSNEHPPTLTTLTNRDLVRSYVVYTMCSFPTIVDLGPKIIDWCYATRIPGVKWVMEKVVRITFFEQVSSATARERGRERLNVLSEHRLIPAEYLSCSRSLQARTPSKALLPSSNVSQAEASVHSLRTVSRPTRIPSLSSPTTTPKPMAPLPGRLPRLIRTSSLPICAPSNSPHT